MSLRENMQRQHDREDAFVKRYGALGLGAVASDRREIYRDVLRQLDAEDDLVAGAEAKVKELETRLQQQEAAMLDAGGSWADAAGAAGEEIGRLRAELAAQKEISANLAQELQIANSSEPNSVMDTEPNTPVKLFP